MADTMRRQNNLFINTDLNDGQQPTAPVGATETGSPFGFLERATKLITDRLATNADAKTTEGQQAAGVAGSDAWGTTIRKEQFQDMDMLESGNAHEYITEECLSPTQSKSWTYSTVERTNKTQYKMYWNNDQFLLSAKQVGGTFYISQYEHFPDTEGDEPTGHYCAILRKVGENNFKLYNCGCEGCDMSFNTFSCCNIHEDANALTEGADRQLLADISHFTKAAGVVGSEMRCFSVIIPAVMEDRRSRVVWCPRVSRSVTPSGGTPRGAPKRELVTSPSPHNRQHKFKFDVPTGDRVKIGSKLPVWCPEVNSLMLKFHGGRIREASAKNFMLMIEDEPVLNGTAGATARTDSPSGQGVDNNRVVMQFGKFSKSKFALDFRYPLAPVQAFAVGLSSCAWNVKSTGF
ncbi:hypothetical protein Poli38472_013763 [Pythium oligandrum]|uniref:Tubby C-terminal domain-containing protein n=1 Tax=Pythium oligandrum TaxID=41045 RepID=A0A8K1CDR2_PYTOL|nr:hypothetical protein Poli38472_013763 [Pythium oligandrum]|eukprot:TMW61300.1 hypothetical protein Poli38472_013763 [Pythium oligandrum]